MLAKWYNLNVFFQNPELKKMEFGGRLKRYEDISYLLEKMEETQDVQFIIHGNNYYKRKNRLKIWSNLQSAELKYTFLVICTGRKSISCII